MKHESISKALRDHRLVAMELGADSIDQLLADNAALRVRVVALEKAMESIEFKSKRATASHDKNCTCAACDTKRDARAVLEAKC